MNSDLPDATTLHDVFICHASEDKDAFVRALAEALRSHHVEVWYDEFALDVGDSLREAIDRGARGVAGRCCTARSKSLTSLCRLQSHPAQYVSGIPSAAILLSISHPIRCSTRCLANVRARISGPMIAL